MISCLFSEKWLGVVLPYISLIEKKSHNLLLKELFINLTFSELFSKPLTNYILVNSYTELSIR